MCENIQDPYGILAPIGVDLRCKFSPPSVRPCRRQIGNSSQRLAESKRGWILGQDPYDPNYKECLYELLKDQLCSRGGRGHREAFLQHQKSASHLDKAIDDLIHQRRAVYPALASNKLVEILQKDAWRQCSMLMDVIDPITGDESTRPGYVYVIAGPPAESCNPLKQRLLKIGFSKDPRSRAGQIQAECSFSTEVFWQSSYTRFGRQIEKLIQAELRIRGLRRIFKCIGSKCHAEHREWFEIEVKDAIHTAEHWVKWLATYDPYDVDGSFICNKWKILMDDSMHGFLLNSQAEPWYRRSPERSHSTTSCTCERKDDCKRIENASLQNNLKPEQNSERRSSINLPQRPSTR